MDALVLSRIQFGFTIGFHYLFPVSTLGLTLFIVILETLYFVKKTAVYKSISSFLIGLLGPIFIFGVATGLMMPFAFGANWSRFSIFAGSILGTALSLEAIFAFAIESAFLAILVFGRSKVSPFLYWVSACFVFAGAHVSGLLIVSANSWMQTPDGFTVVNGQAVMTGYLKAFLNPSTLIRFIHVVIAAWITGAFAISAIGAYYAYNRRYPEFAKALLSIALPIAFITSAVQPVLGHSHILNVLKYNPEKSRAYEGIFKTTKGATVYFAGIPDEKNGVIHFGLGIPYGLSFLETGNPFSIATGLEEYPRKNWPPVNIIFTTFHLMVGLGIVMILIAGWGMFMLYRKKIFEARFYLRILPWFVAVPYIVNELGWMGAEIGRQPWIIYNVLHTAEASSANVPAWQVICTLSVIGLLYAALLIIALNYLLRQVKNGPRAL
jgi:cytochrome d ubiquinol oxidase subunit I